MKCPDCESSSVVKAKLSYTLTFDYCTSCGWQSETAEERMGDEEETS